MPPATLSRVVLAPFGTAQRPRGTAAEQAQHRGDSRILPALDRQARARGTAATRGFGAKAE